MYNMSQDAQSSRHARLKSLVGLTLITVVIGAAVIRAASPSLTAPEPASPVLTIAPPGLAATAKLAAEFRIAPRDRAAAVLLVTRPREKGWREFEAEYGITEPHPSRFLGAIQLAKYTLDEATFGADQFLKTLSRALEIEYRSSGWKYAPQASEEKSSRQVRSPFENTKLKFDIALQNGSPYLGVRVIVPFGR